MVAFIATSPLSVNLMALPTRLSSTCTRRRSSPWPRGKFEATSIVKASSFAVGDFNPRKDGVYDLLERVVGEVERQLTGLDLGQVRHVVDQTEEVLAVDLQAFQHLPHLVRRFSVNVIRISSV